MKSILFFDIETTANPDAIALLPEPSAPANYKDQDKITQYIIEKKAEQIAEEIAHNTQGVKIPCVS